MKLLLIDIETAPNIAHVWGMFKQNVGLNQLMDSSYTMCYAAKWYGSRDTKFARHTDDNFLVGLWDLLNEADAVIHYNGTKFDMPTINKEFVLAGMEPPAPYKQIDLLRVVRKQFRFPSNKLDYVSQQLGLGKKTKHVGHELWVKCMAKDEQSWKIMKRYNIQDVKLLEKLYKWLLPWIDNHPNYALYTDSVRPVCTNCGSGKVYKKGTEHTKTLTYQRYKCQKCGTNMRGRLNILPTEKKKAILTQSKI